MSRIVKPSLSLVVLLCANIMLTSCKPNYQPKNKSEQAITDIRVILDLPQNEVHFIENTKMSNSPNGDLKVAHYQDIDGRDYFVDTAMNKVVEIDARKLLPSLTSNSSTLTEKEINSKVDQIISKLYPNDINKLNLLTYESNGKTDNYFYSWRDNDHMGSSMPPFLQLGFHKSGLLFAYINTLMIN